MKTLKEYIVSVNLQFRYKLMYFMGNLLGVKAVYQVSEIPEPVPAEKQEIKQVVINHEIVVEPMAKNMDLLPRYYHLTPKMITSLYNLITCSYWDKESWNSLLYRAYQDDIHSQLGYALREAMSDEICFPAIN